ncbi:MAG: hypothetical protein LQ337_002905 [Flavoplaca oasis]|nr:MAG: hypothetical protein LQ337_002905 [Flavoplaca oasis]
MAEQQPSTNAIDLERAVRLRQIQMEALGTSRRDFLTTHDGADQFVGRLSTSNVEHHRRANQTGTHESKAANAHRDILAGWNSAWEKLQNDEALEQGLEDIKAGQSHRARLLTLVPQVQAASSAADDVQGRARGGFNPRGTGRGGRGGSIIGSRPARTARKRIPIDADKDRPAQPAAALKLALPSASRMPNVPALKIKFPTTSDATGSSTGDSKSRVRIQAQSTIRPKQPPKFSADVTSSSKPLETTSQTVADAMSAEKPKASKRTPPGEISSQSSAALSDGDTNKFGNKQLPSLHHSYAVDLLGMDIDDTNQLPKPMQLSNTTHTDRSISSLPPTQPSLELFSSQLASYLPILKGVLPAESWEKLESVGVDLARRIQEPASGASQQSSSIIQSSEPERKPNEKESPATQGRASAVRQTQAFSDAGTQQQPSLTYQTRKKVGQPARGLASAVQQQTLAWGKDVISGAETGSTSILGENISRWRFSRRRISVDSLASVVSAGSSTALTDRIDQLQIGESRSPTNPSVTGIKETYATTNPFGPKPTRGSTSGLSLSTSPPRISIAKTPGIHVTGPELPLFLRSEVRANDPAAAIQAEYAANFPGRLSRHEPAKNWTSGATVASQGAPFVKESSSSREQSYSREIGATGSRPENLIRDRDSTRSRNSSTISASVARKELGEARTPSRRTNDIQPEVSDEATNGSTFDGNLPRFHPRLGNPSVLPSRGLRPTQTYFSDTRRRTRVPPGPSLPSFLANVQAAQDPGAAAVEQYSRDHQHAPDKKSTGL